MNSVSKRKKISTSCWTTMAGRTRVVVLESGLLTEVIVFEVKIVWGNR